MVDFAKDMIDDDFNNRIGVKVDWATVTLFEKRIADFFGAPYAVAVDSCTHGLELCLRYKDRRVMSSPIKTYLSVPMLANKLDIHLFWNDMEWSEHYPISQNIIDAATLWRANSYLPNSFTCISFQYQKHLSLGRGGMILCDSKQAAQQLKKMSYDGRLPGIPWRDQDVKIQGFHYYCTPEVAALGLSKLDAAINAVPKIWSYLDYPDLSKMTVFQK